MALSWLSLLQARRKELVIYGNGAGQLTAFDVALGEEVWRVEDCHEGYALQAAHLSAPLQQHCCTPSQTQRLLG